MKKRLYIGFLLFGLLFVRCTFAAQEPWEEWLAELRSQAVSDGISPSVFDQAFAGMHAPQQKVLGLAGSQPEHRLSYPQYLNTRASQDRIALGKREFQKYRGVLENIQRSYGVDECVITALWGMETSYGRFMGDFPTVQALATLAYQSNRPEVFRKEVFLALHMLNDGDVSLQQFKGEWAGATGQCQFLPSSWYQYAVDYDHDGRKNIWSSVPDVLASIANYLRGHGWQAGQPVMIVAKFPAHFDARYLQTREVKTLREWAALGVRSVNGESLDSDARAFVVHPDGGPEWLALENFRAILGYNNSIYYVGAINYMADRICQH